MYQSILRTVVALAAFLNLTLASYEVQPQYQVSIMWEFPTGNQIHLCNGVIVTEKLILTTANCLHFKLSSQGNPTKLDASVLSVLAGSANALTEPLRVNVSTLSFAEDFNPRTLENDLALLTLNQSLPLDKRTDMKWIMLGENVPVNQSCLANFFSRNSKDAIPNFYQTEEVSLRTNEICRNFTQYPGARKNDICSIYVLPRQLDCKAADTFLSFNNDRGTGLICQDYLYGLLSSVVTRPSPKNNCTDVELSAFYTNIYPHLFWIMDIISNVKAEYVSAPYDSSVNLLMVNSTNDADDNESLNPMSSSNSSIPTEQLFIITTPRKPAIGNWSTPTNSVTERSKPQQSSRAYTLVERSPTTIPPLTSATDSLRCELTNSATVTSSTAFCLLTAFISSRLIPYQ